MVSTLRPMMFVQSLHGLMQVRLDRWAKSQTESYPQFKLASVSPEVCLAGILKADPNDAQIHWRTQAGSLLKEAAEAAPKAAPPKLVADALQVWFDKDRGLAEKTELIDGIYAYLVEQIGQLAYGDVEGPSTPEAAIPEPVSPAVVTPFSGLLEDGGLGILRELGALKVEEPGVLEEMIDRRILQLPYAILAARIEDEDAFGVISIVNGSFCEQFGWNEEDILGSSFRDLLQKNSPAELVGLPAAIVTGEFQPTELKVMRGDGKYLKSTVAAVYKRWHAVYSLIIFTAFEDGRG